MGFNNVRSLVSSYVDLGQYHIGSFRRVLTQATVAGGWVDLSMASGNPTPNYYASTPLTSAVLAPTDGLNYGSSCVGSRHLARLTFAAGSSFACPLTAVLCDYLLYYPFVDMDSTDAQTMSNTLQLPRYSDGAGVQAFLVAQGSYIGGAAFTINYTNSAGATNRVSGTCVSNVTTFTNSLITSGPGASTMGPFIPLQSGDSGIQSVQSITFQSGNGGIAALVLCKPLATAVLREVGAPVERDYFTQFPSAPRIYNGAHLNFIAQPNATMASAPVLGTIETVWGND